MAQRGTTLEDDKVDKVRWQLDTNHHFHNDETAAGRAWRTACDVITMESWPHILRRGSQDERGLFGTMDQKVAGHHTTLMAYQVSSKQNN